MVRCRFYDPLNNSTATAACDAAFVNWAAKGYRLPTDGEWQLAAGYKGPGSVTMCTWASGSSADVTNAVATGSVSWYNANASGSTKTVGLKQANQLGIYDMSGNVWEFV